LVAEYEASGLTRVEFCRTRGLSLATLARYRKRQAQVSPAPENRWVAVEVTGAGPASPAASGLAVALPDGLRIEIGRGFDAPTLAHLLAALERR
jgi:hypothetical protein